ncbi:hypothetical protein [Nonomuraea sp. NPDC049480]|uniref:hypothetical protein n=1 Tax=Nonomuraea sp. NPDC049480 TaxID=3364353 RepID=UPI0037977607
MTTPDGDRGLPARKPWISAVRGLWPAALAVGMTAATFGGTGSPEKMESLAHVLVLLPLLYLVVAKLDRREASWPVLGILILPFIVLRALDVIPPSAVFGGLALAVLIWGAMDGQLRRPGPFRVQALGMAGFAAFAVAGLIADPELGRYLVAAGWFLHGVWDFVHLKLDKVVSRSYALWCGILDVLIAIELIFAL